MSPQAPVDEHGEELLANELNQLSFKDRNDYQGKLKDSIEFNLICSTVFIHMVLYALTHVNHVSLFSSYKSPLYHEHTITNDRTNNR